MEAGKRTLESKGTSSVMVLGVPSRIDHGHLLGGRTRAWERLYEILEVIGRVYAYWFANGRDGLVCRGGER